MEREERQGSEEKDVCQECEQPSTAGHSVEMSNWGRRHWGICREALLTVLTGEMASCCRLVGTREEAVKAGRMWVANLGSICSWGLHWKLSLGIIRESNLTKSDRWTLRRARLEGDGGDKDAPHTWWVCFNPAEKISNSLEIRNSGT